MRHCHKGQQRRGFTLIEVLVALAVLAVGLGFAFEALSGGFEWSRRSRDEEAALSIAEATLARVGNDIALKDGIETGRAENGMTWRVEITPYEDASSGPSSILSGHDVKVVVRWTASHYDREVRLATMRLGPKDHGS